MPTAKPWKQTKRKRVEQPKLRVAVLADVSLSMSEVTPTVSSTMWVVANAVHDTGGLAAGYSFGASWDTIVSAGSPPKQVADFGASGGTLNPGYAVQQAIKDLALDEPGPRVVVVVSDGGWTDTDSEGDLADKELQKLKDDGVVILQVMVGETPSEHVASQTCVLDSVDEIPSVIGQACVTELEKA